MIRVTIQQIQLWLCGFISMLVSCGVFAQSLFAQDLSVLVVSGQHNHVHGRLINSLQAHKPAAVKITPVHIKTFRENPSQYDQHDLIVPVGTQATLAVSEAALKTPVLSALIPKLSYDYIRTMTTGKNRSDGDFSAIYIDQPLQRRIKLIREILPDARQVAVILGPNTLKYEKALRAQARRQKLKLVISKVGETDNLIRALERILEKSDVLLAVIDPAVFNSNRVQSILLTTYRFSIPMIGVSPGYTKAGALAAVHSTPEQIGRQLAQVLSGFKPGDALAAPRYPKYFKVDVNRQVARSLGIAVPAMDHLNRKMDAEP